MPELVAVVYEEMPFAKAVSCSELYITMQIFYIEDSYYADSDFGYISARGATLPNFMTFSERFQHLYASKGYVLDIDMRIRASPRAKTVNLSQLLDVLSSTDE
eukprot:CAMPEP_0176349728 /NCGR_PEP_ID=MMETSP0126-20121128/8908_1 /TAXON_ID=141414 ORGANISM="Strombidinopsis acuminatum, Strain SPMC142" /NCGR_SAMPLE_ID=MMETSP0126 /ASSEMBLY_ACC=CAM_ASM_000229 /LENGTH=102 /DNA_ID=CAMNT_0017699315 /DNA_START=211 /DNA_END=519 /DNA_ORIENTATION=-